MLKHADFTHLCVADLPPIWRGKPSAEVLASQASRLKCSPEQIGYMVTMVAPQCGLAECYLLWCRSTSSTGMVGCTIMNEQTFVDNFGSEAVDRFNEGMQRLGRPTELAGTFYNLGGNGARLATDSSEQSARAHAAGHCD
jgi:hypothetical protein